MPPEFFLRHLMIAAGQPKRLCYDLAHLPHVRGHRGEGIDRFRMRSWIADDGGPRGANVFGIDPAHAEIFRKIGGAFTRPGGRDSRFERLKRAYVQPRYSPSHAIGNAARWDGRWFRILVRTDCALDTARDVAASALIRRILRFLIGQQGHGDGFPNRRSGVRGTPGGIISLSDGLRRKSLENQSNQIDIGWVGYDSSFNANRHAATPFFVRLLPDAVSSSFSRPSCS